LTGRRNRDPLLAHPAQTPLKNPLGKVPVQRRPAELRYAPLRDGYLQKLVSSYAWLENELDVDSPLHVGHIAVATALDWLEFRQLPPFRERRPRLTRWCDEFARRPR
jgi:glutathione S-transferase